MYVKVFFLFCFFFKSGGTFKEKPTKKVKHESQQVLYEGLCIMSSKNNVVSCSTRSVNLYFDTVRKKHLKDIQ